MAAVDAARPADPTEMLLAAWRRFSYNPVMVAATSTAADTVGDVAVQYGAAMVEPLGSSRTPSGVVRLVRPGDPLITSAEVLTSAAELLGCTEPEWFSGEIGAALDDKLLGPYGLLETKIRVGRLFDLSAHPAGVREDIARLLQPEALKVLAFALPFLQLVDLGIAQINAGLPKRVGDVVSDEPDPESDTYAFLCDPGLPVEVAGILLRKAKSGIAVALLDAAVSIGVPVPPWMAFTCASLITHSAREQLEGLLASPFVNLPQAAQLGVRPIDLEGIWAKHAAVQQGYKALVLEAEASGLDIYPPIPPGFDDDE